MTTHSRRNKPMPGRARFQTCAISTRIESIEQSLAALLDICRHLEFAISIYCCCTVLCLRNIWEWKPHCRDPVCFVVPVYVCCSCEAVTIIFQQQGKCAQAHGQISTMQGKRCEEGQHHCKARRCNRWWGGRNGASQPQPPRKCYITDIYSKYTLL